MKLKDSIKTWKVPEGVLIGKNSIVQGYLKNLIRNDIMKGKKKMWYAVQINREDDWNTGSYDREEAIRMAREQLAEYPETLIAVIDNSTGNPVCVDEITDL